MDEPVVVVVAASNNGGSSTSQESASRCNQAASNNGGCSTSQESASRSNQTSIGSYVTKPLSNKRKKEIDFLLLETIVENYLPFQIVESAKLRQLISKLNSAYTLPTRKTLANVILPQLYSMSKEMVRE